MKPRKDILHFTGTNFLLCLFVLLFSYFIQKTSHQNNDPIQVKQIFVLKVNPINATTVTPDPLPQGGSSVSEKADFNFYNPFFKILADNKAVCRKIIHLKKVRQKIKLSEPKTFYFFLLPHNFQDFPVLS
jgi:hypothetical protein